MNEHFYNGFIKRAQQYGLTVVEAERLCKSAGWLQNLFGGGGPDPSPGAQREQLEREQFERDQARLKTPRQGDLPGASRQQYGGETPGSPNGSSGSAPQSRVWRRIKDQDGNYIIDHARQAELNRGAQPTPQEAGHMYGIEQREKPNIGTKTPPASRGYTEIGPGLHPDHSALNNRAQAAIQPPLRNNPVTQARTEIIRPGASMPKPPTGGARFGRGNALGILAPLAIGAISSHMSKGNVNAATSTPQPQPAQQPQPTQQPQPFPARVQPTGGIQG